MADTPDIDWTVRSAADGMLAGPAGGDEYLWQAVTADEAILGQARALASDGSYHLLELSVIPAQRGRGIGRALVGAVESFVVADGASALTLLASDPDAARFFAHLGFVELPRLPVALRWLATRARPAAAQTDRVVPMGKSLAPDVVPRPAVSVLPLRDGAAGLEVFVQHRVATMDFAAGAVVFPGGRVDPEDYQTTLEVPPNHELAWAKTALPSAETLAATAIREVAEECGVLLAPADLVPWDNWVTPPGGRRRFDVGFFVTAVPAQQSEHWGNATTEAVRSAWESVADLLVAEIAGTVRLMPPTKTLLTELAGFASCAEVVAHAPLITAVMDDEPVRPRPPGAQLSPTPHG